MCLFTAFGTDGVHMQLIPLGRQLHFIYVVWGHLKKMFHKVGEIGSAVKACAANSDDPSLIQRPTWWEGLSSDLHMHVVAHMQTLLCTLTHSLK